MTREFDRAMYETDRAKNGELIVVLHNIGTLFVAV